MEGALNLEELAYLAWNLSKLNALGRLLVLSAHYFCPAFFSFSFGSCLSFENINLFIRSASVRTCLTFSENISVSYQAGRPQLCSGISWVKDSCQHLYLWLVFNCEAQQVSKQHAGEGAGRPHISAKCSQSSFPDGHVDSMMASRGALCSYEIFNLLSPQVWTDHLQASVACSEPRDQMSLGNTHARTHTYRPMHWKYACKCPHTG